MDDTVLDPLILGCNSLFNAQQRAMAARLTLHPASADAPLDIAELRSCLTQAWPESCGPLALNFTSEVGLRALLQSLSQEGVVPQWQIEVPAFMLTSPEQTEELQALVQRGQALVLKGRPLAPLTSAQLGLFKYAIIELGEERRAGVPAAGQTRVLPFVQAGALTPADAMASFERGAQAVLGWPLGDPPEAGAKRKDLPASVRVVMDLMQRLDRDEPVDRLDAVLRGDPALAFRLMRYINSPGFGLSVEVNSFQHAIMILGYQRLKRWLALLLASAVQGADMRPLMVLAVRRGLLMEELARQQGDEALRNEAFICGVFSLLDRMLGQSFSALLDNLPVPERVAQALIEHIGAHAPGLDLCVAVEAGLPHDILDATEGLMLTPGDINRAVLKALVASRQLQLD